MPKRTRLLASVAMPLISISLLVPSVHAAMPGVQPPMRGVQSDIIHVQAPAPAPEGAPAEEELKKRRPPPEAQGERPRGEPGQPRAQQGEARPERPEGEPQREPQGRPRGEPQGGPRAEPEGKPRAEPQPEPRAEQPRPKRAEPQAEAPPKPAPEPKAEQPKPEPPREPKPEPQREPKPEVKPEPPKAAAPAERTAPPAEPAPRPAEPAQRAAPPAEPAPAPRPAPPAEPAPQKPAPERPAGERPRNEARPGEAPQGEPGRPAPAERPAVPPAPPAGAQQPAPPAVQPGTPPAPPAAPPIAPPPGQRSDAAPVAPQPAQPPVAATPKTPQDIERAKAIANNPAQAQGTVVLPVENGAAVLDSAKEAPAAAVAPPPAQPGAPPVPGQRRDGQRTGVPPVPGQAQAPAPVPAAPAPTAPPPPPPTSDAAAQAAAPGAQPMAPVRIESFSRIQGERLRERPRFEDPRGWDDVRRADDGRVIIQFDNRTFVRHDDSERFISDGYRPEYDRLPGGRTRETYERDGGVQIVTIRNRYGDVVQRSRIGRDGREIILFYAPELADERADRDYRWRDPGAELPPMRLTIPVNQYIIDTTSDPDRDYYRFLEQPPVERVERVYSVDEVRYSARIRDKVRRIDLDTITFATGSADIPMNQASSLRKVADAIKKVLDRDPSETFLIEGHTDAVGSDESNLVLSDRRAESVARVLTDAFGIPPENMVTQGYGERYLKVATQGPEQQNRRVTIRRITALVKPVAQNR